MKNALRREIEHGMLNHVSKGEIPYQIIHGWDLESSAECDKVWRRGWLELFNQIQQAEPDVTRQDAILDSISLEDCHWKWFDKAISCCGDEYEWFHLYAEGKPQAVCLIYHPKESALEHGDIFYVKFVAVAPWNRDCSLRAREFKRLGVIILRAAQRFVVKELKLRPGFGLHSLPKAEGFYARLNMINVPGAEDGQLLSYYELPSDLAIQLMETN